MHPLPSRSGPALSGIRSLVRRDLRYREAGEGGANVTWKKGVFDESVDLDELVEMSYRSKPVGPNHEGHYERYVDAGTLVGRTSEMTGKKPTSWLLVSQDERGGVRTMYPIEKPAV
ncbi:hypothetical protein [Streptomyces sp. NPDC055189]